MKRGFFKKAAAMACGVLLLLSAAPVAAASEIIVTLDGTAIKFDQPPIIKDGRTLVPMRAIFEAMGAEVSWEEASRVVTGTSGDTVVKMQIGSNVITKNGQQITLDVPPQIVNDRTLVPVRAVAESFEAKVDWNGEARTVIIETRDILLVVNEEINSPVSVYHVANSSLNQPEEELYKVVDLKDVKDYYEYADSYEDLEGLYDTFPQIIFMADGTVKDFRFLKIDTVLEEDLGIAIEETLYQLDELTPEKPFVASWISIGDVGMYRGISFVDKAGTTRYFSFNTSGYDGNMYLIEFKPQK